MDVGFSLRGSFHSEKTSRIGVFAGSERILRLELGVSQIGPMEDRPGMVRDSHQETSVLRRPVVRVKCLWIEWKRILSYRG